jgi:hypothetical protein
MGEIAAHLAGGAPACEPREGADATRAAI